jgi:ribosomal protein S12 methylthiotransferase accessory factor
MNLQHHPPSMLEETLRKAARLVDDETGIVKLLYEAPACSDAPRIFGCGSMCSDFSDLGYPSEAAVSGSTSMIRDQALAGAIGEAVERYSAAFVPYDQLVFEPYKSVIGEALSPCSLTLYSDDQYERPGFGYKPVSPEQSIGWVTGHSLTRDCAVLVPAFAVYQPYRSRSGESPVIQQVTTGLACGNTLEEAILSATCEVVERDAAMLMWLQKRRPPKVFDGNISPTLLSAVLERFGGSRQFVSLLDITTDLSIPAYIAVWDGPIYGKHGTIFASCASLSPGRAAAGALTELAQCLMWAGSLLDSAKHVPDPAIECLSEIEDHVLWPLGNTARSAFAFALASQRTVSFAERPEPRSRDVLHAIMSCVEMIAAAGLEVVAVDVTAPDILESGLRVVRVLIPGTQPLYFGTGLHRVSDRARQNPYPDRDSDALNLHPHPFP